MKKNVKNTKVKEAKSNIITGHSKKEYEKKYGNYKYKLLFFSKEQVIKFDKDFGHYYFDEKKESLHFDYFLLKDKTWWEINDVFYEIPRKISYASFLSLSLPLKVLLCAFCGGLVATAIVVPTAMTISSLIDRTQYFIDDSMKDKVEIESTSKENGTGNTIIKLKIKDRITNVISNLNIKKGVLELSENVDYTYNRTLLEVNIKKSVFTSQKGNVLIKPFMHNPTEVVTKEQWLSAYKTYSDNFQNSNKLYSLDKITITGTTRGYTPTFYYSKYSAKMTDVKCFNCNFLLKTSTSTGSYELSQFPFAGGVLFEKSKIDENYITPLGQTYTNKYYIGSNYLEIKTFATGNEDTPRNHIKFNEYGYLTRLKDNSNYDIEINYQGSPNEDLHYTYFSLTGYKDDNSLTGSYFAFNKVSSAVDNCIEFKAGNRYKFDCRTARFVKEEQQNGLNVSRTYKVGIKSLNFVEAINAKDYITDLSGIVNGVNKTVSFSDNYINSIELSDADEVKDYNIDVSFTFKATKDFKAKLRTYGVATLVA